MSSAYRVAPLFLIRLAGVPFDAVETLATPAIVPLARALAAKRKECAEASQAAEDFFHSRRQLLAPEVYHELRRAVRRQCPPATFAAEQPAVFSNYATASRGVEKLNGDLETALEGEVQAARRALLRASGQFLPGYLLFGAEGVRDFLNKKLEQEKNGRLAPRNNAARKVEQSLLLYLQRIAAKNDTFSEFGPSGWGKVEPECSAIRFNPRPGNARREAFLERWTAHALAAAMNSDPQILSELSPRLNPNGVLLNDKFVFVDGGEVIALSPAETALLRQCDGKTPVHKLEAGEGQIRDLVRRRVLFCEVEVPALDPFAFEKLCADVAAFQNNAVRERWLPRANDLAQLPKKFAATGDSSRRRELMAEARQKLSALGAERKPGQRSLYSAINPIGEECFRETKFEIRPELLDQIATEAEPWIDFWRDSYAFVASRIAGNLRSVFEKAPVKNGALPLPAFLRACEIAKLPLTGPGLVGLSVMAFQEVKGAFRQRMQPHAANEEYELTSDDCHILRDEFQFEKFNEFTWPSADLQLAAVSTEAISRGQYRWILSELHPPAALLHHAGYWSCPDKPRLNDALATVAGKTFHFGFFAADFTAHTTVRAFDAIPELTTFVSTQRSDPRWRAFPPALTEVYLQETSGDVRLRHGVTREDFGSFARNWIVALGFHPFQFGLKPHMPRLRCGRVIVQRRSWIVSANELGVGDFSGLSRDLVVAVEKLRATKQWPRWVYIRPSEEALRRSGAEGRDKDTKPVFIDLESYLFLEIFHRWLSKAGELEITEMLPTPDELWWHEADGRRTFELRTLIVPR